MSAKQFLADAEGGVVPVDSHEKVMWIAFIYMDEGLWDGNGVFDVVETLHARGWSFGEGGLRFNRTLDIFYLAQLAAAIYHATNQLHDDFPYPSPDDFQSFYSTHHALLHPSAWHAYYTPAFLAHPTTARFYRLPNLQDLPDSDSPSCQPRQRPPSSGAHATKIPCWASIVAGTRRRQLTLPPGTFTELALRTLETSTARLHAEYPSIVPAYSETQARFWLNYMGLDSDRAASASSWNQNRFGGAVAQGWYDIYAWEGKYSAEAWEGSCGKGREVIEPDVEDGTWKSEVMWCGWPDGGIEFYTWLRGWDGEVGGEEEVEFLAAVAVEETKGVEMGDLDLAVRSHILLGVMGAAVKTGQEREDYLQELEKGVVQSRRIKEDKAGVWLKGALAVIEPYVRIWDGVWPEGEEERGEMLRRILVENGQLFARYKLSPHLKEFNFELGPRKLV
ncbi:hypothetical protein ASPCAL04927 [Aspergillus calidoustus]|uniref:Rta1 domain protein n=1 Tax=Aspergillus calidoustus TaxID=454130 RepID=A0A0U5G010_ASPCI|nr:hypothetical protein ASPCAL04927 [Aspergillus calidoustus]